MIIALIQTQCVHLYLQHTIVVHVCGRSVPVQDFCSNNAEATSRVATVCGAYIYLEYVVLHLHSTTHEEHNYQVLFHLHFML